MNSPRRILMVSEPGEYGVLIYVRNLITRLLERGLGIDLAYSSRRGSAALEKLVADVIAHGGRAVDLHVGNAPEPGDLPALRTIFQLVRRQPDLVHAHSSKAGALVRLASLAPGFPPVLYSPHGYYGMSRRGGVKDRVFNGIETVLGHLGTTHVVSDYERDFAVGKLRVPGGRVELIYHGVDVKRFAPVSVEAKKRLRVELGLPPESRLLAAVGRDSYEKNFGALYAVLNEVLPGAAWHFAHAGGSAGELKAGLSSDAQRNVTTFDYLDRPEKLMAAADGLVVPSRSEAFGLVAYEAFSCGLPLILTATTGLLSLKNTGSPGIRWLPDPRGGTDIEPEMKRAILEWASAPLFDAARQHLLACEWFNEPTQLDKVAALYERLIAARSGREF